MLANIVNFLFHQKSPLNSEDFFIIYRVEKRKNINFHFDSIGFRNATSFVMLTEFTTEKHRAKIGVGSFYFWVAGLMVLPLIGYFVTEWRYLLLATACFAIPCLFTWW